MKNKLHLLFICMLLITGRVVAQNQVTFIPPNPEKAPPPPPPAKMDTIVTMIDVSKNYRRVVILQNDITIQDGYYIGNTKTGKWYLYAPTGLIINIAEYENGVKNGVYLEFDKGGALVLQESYNMGKLDGEQKKYGFAQNTRVLKSSLSYKNGVYDGLNTEFTETGLVRNQTQYKEGKKHGTSRWYYNNGKMAMLQTYSNDMLNGPQKIYNQQGNVTSEGDNQNNQKSGVWTEYYDNGKIKSQGAYTADKQTGTWKYFDENGTLTRTETF